jgi:hypothetical protein
VNDDAADIALIRLVDELEAKAESYLTVDDVERAAGFAVSQPIADGLLLVDHRTRADGTPVTVCRLNRHHPLVARLTGW